MKAGTLEVLNRLSETLLARRNADPSTSYTASLFAKGPDAILKKIGEESAELIMAAKDGKRLHIVNEATDVVYHVLVLMAFSTCQPKISCRKCIAVKAFPVSMKSGHVRPNPSPEFIHERELHFL